MHIYMYIGLLWWWGSLCWAGGCQWRLWPLWTRLSFLLQCGWSFAGNNYLSHSLIFVILVFCVCLSWLCLNHCCVYCECTDLLPFLRFLPPQIFAWSTLLMQVCPKHGTDFLEYKCRYCCTVAVYFCFGTTHFCNPCHDDFQRLTSMRKDELPQCPVGPCAKPLEGTECPLHVKHPPTGEEFALGCGVCRNAQTF